MNSNPNEINGLKPSAPGEVGWSIRGEKDSTGKIILKSDPAQPAFRIGDKVRVSFINFTGQPAIIGIVHRGQVVTEALGPGQPNRDIVNKNEKYCWIKDGMIHSGIVPLLDQKSVTLDPFQIPNVDLSNRQQADFSYGLFCITDSQKLFTVADHGGQPSGLQPMGHVIIKS